MVIRSVVGRGRSLPKFRDLIQRLITLVA